MSETGNWLWAAYVRAVAGDVPAQAIADRITDRIGRGVSQPTVNRWLNGEYSGELKPANVAAFASAYDRPVLQAFLAAGLLAPDDVVKGLSEEEVAFVLVLESVELTSYSRRAARGPRRRRPQLPRA